MSYPWSELGIDETDDKKVIKKAYAKLIRQYRPEDEPEKFQEVNQAYQYALQLLKNGQSNDRIKASAVSSEYPSSIQDVTTKAEDVAGKGEQAMDADLDSSNLSATEQLDTGGQDSPDETNEDDPEVILGNEILEQFHQMAFAEYRIKKQATSWAFLEQYHQIQDLQLRDSLSKELFKRVVEYNSFQQQENSTLLLNQTIVYIVADVLGWESKWQELEQTFPEQYVTHVFNLIESLNPEKKSGHLYLRIFALILEIVSVYISVKLFGLDKLGVSKEFVFIFIFILVNSFSCLTTNHLPVIQYMFDFRLFDNFLNQPEIKQKIIRLITFHVSMIPIYMIITLNGFGITTPWLEIICCSVLVINIIPWFKNKQLFHDWISGTIMMK